MATQGRPCNSQKAEAPSKGSQRHKLLKGGEQSEHEVGQENVSRTQLVLAESVHAHELTSHQSVGQPRVITVRRKEKQSKNISLRRIDPFLA